MNISLVEQFIYQIASYFSYSLRDFVEQWKTAQRKFSYKLQHNIYNFSHFIQIYNLFCTKVLSGCDVGYDYEKTLMLNST